MKILTMQVLTTHGLIIWLRRPINRPGAFGIWHQINKFYSQGVNTEDINDAVVNNAWFNNEDINNAYVNNACINNEGVNN